ncbi:zinc-binding dehydrogenase [Anseongella ginsenosidimutans]|nr:zinc-binding dehydrogenase [Anseongella ginsenosidimutans]
MKAAYIRKAGEPVTIQTVNKPVPGEQEMLIRVGFAALNHRDVWIQKGRYAGRREHLVLGSDGAGIVEATGKGVSSGWMGKKVIIYPGMNWGNDPAVQAAGFKILGNPDDGTFAEYVNVPAENVFEFPAHLSMQEAAAIPLSGLTAYRACFTRGGLKAGDKVLITGIGGGTVLFAFQYAAAAGAEVYVTSGSEEKIANAIAMGARGGALYTGPDWPEIIKKKSGGIDLVIDSAAGKDFGKLPELMNPGGRIVNFGQTAGAIEEIPARYLFWKQLSILGSTMGSPADFLSMLEFYTRHQLTPVIDRIFPLEEAEQAFRYMDEGKQFGKILLRM